MGVLSPFGLFDSVGDIDELAGVHAVPDHVLLRVRQQGHHIVAAAVAVVLRLLHHPDIRVAGAHPAQLDGAERPQVVHLVDQHGAGFPRDAARGVNIQRIGGGGDHRVRLPGRCDPPAEAVQSPQEREHVADARHAVAPVGVPGNPEIADAVDFLLFPFRAAEVRVLRAQMRKGARRDGDAVACRRPAPPHVVGAELHSVPRGARVVVDIDDVHAPRPPVPARAAAMRSPAWPSPNGLRSRAAGSGTVRVALR